uniref:Uncharacterized protein n=1 Tax=Oryza sativa subsp. japonica TaxID=39947 RepID=Q2RAV5_ORYSJ|nr:hypothetical protein LOC_Os11g04120 [Oryza sativa Japonica Group]
MLTLMFFLSRTFFPAVLLFRNSVCLRTCTSRQAIKFLGSVLAQLLLFCFDFFLCIAMASIGDGAPGAVGNGSAPGGGGNGSAPGDNTNEGNTNASTSSALFSGGEEADHGRRRQAEAPLLEKKGSTGIGNGYCIERCPGAASTGVRPRAPASPTGASSSSGSSRSAQIREPQPTIEFGHDTEGFFGEILNNYSFSHNQKLSK